MKSINSSNPIRAFIRVQDIATVMGQSTSHIGNFFRELKRNAGINTQGIHIDTFFLHNQTVPHLKDIKRDDILRVIQ